MDTTQDTTQEVADAASTETRDARRLAVGRIVRQGDVYIARQADMHPVGTDRRGDQVATGTSVGARHIVVGGGAEVWSWPTGSWTSPYVSDWARGPMVAAAGEWTLTHPEHADVLFSAGRYGVIYQQDPRRAAAVLD